MINRVQLDGRHCNKTTNSSCKTSKVDPPSLFMSLEEVSTEALVAEIARRLECQNKPERRLILIGPPGCGKVRRSTTMR